MEMEEKLVSSISSFSNNDFSAIEDKFSVVICFSLCEVTHYCLSPNPHYIYVAHHLSVKMGHVAIKTKSNRRKFLCREAIFSPVLMKLGQKVSLNYITIKLESGSRQVKK